MSLCMLLTSSPARAQAAGEVEYSRGVGFAQAPGQAPRTLGKGLPLEEGDRLTTADGASAVIKLQDGTRMTVRPNTEILLQQIKFRENAPDNSLVMQLFRGGLRAVTGLIAKSSPNAARIQTNTATIGIRGTDFDARVCARDCGAEVDAINERARPNAIKASAKVITVRGDINAVDSSGQRRRLVDGGGIYPGDLVETGAATQAVLAFRDDSRITLGATTRFRIDNFVYDSKAPAEGRFLVSLLKGSVRALSGLIAKANNRNVSYSTSTATIGIRGTEFSMDCTGVCAGEADAADAGLSLYTWLGSITVNPQGQTALQALEAGQGLFISPSRTAPISTPPTTPLSSPGQTPIPDSLFSGGDINELEQGLYVYVRDGHVEVTTDRGVLHLGRDEVGFAGPDARVIRPGLVPRFIDFDLLPQPNARNLVISSMLVGNGIRSARVCR